MLVLQSSNHSIGGVEFQKNRCVAMMLWRGEKRDK